MNTYLEIISSKCTKCGDPANQLLATGGVTYKFCAHCWKDIEDAPDGSTKIEDFIKMNKNQWIERNIRLAKERRERGEGLWQTNDPKST